MKTTPFRIAVMTAAAALALVGCKPPQSGIVILPVNSDEQQKIEDHWKNIDKLLKGKDELYYINDFSGGKLTGESGKLPSILRVRETGGQQVASDFTGHAFQIGIGLAPAKPSLRYVGPPDAFPRISPTPPPVTKWPHLHLNQQIDQSAELVKAVEDELKKPVPPRPVEH